MICFLIFASNALGPRQTCTGQTAKIIESRVFCIVLIKKFRHARILHTHQRPCGDVLIIEDQLPDVS